VTGARVRRARDRTDTSRRPTDLSIQFYTVDILPALNSRRRIRDGTEVTVRDPEEGTEVVYNADDLVIATSDRELNDAREPNQP